MSDTFRKIYSTDKGLKEFADHLKSLAESLEVHMYLLDSSREKDLALTNLEQAVMWAVKAAYIQGDKRG